MNKLMNPDITAFSMSKSQIEDFALQVKEQVDEGNFSPIQVYGISKGMEKVAAAIQSGVRDKAEMAVRGEMPDGLKTIKKGNLTFTLTERKNYKVEDTPEIEAIKEEIKKLNAQLKEFSTLAKATGVEIQHPVYGTIKPAVLANLTPGLTVSIK